MLGPSLDFIPPGIPKRGAAAKVRVLIEWSDHRRNWTTVGVSDNVIEASWRAMADAIRLERMIG